MFRSVVRISEINRTQRFGQSWVRGLSSMNPRSVLGMYQQQQQSLVSFQSTVIQQTIASLSPLSGFTSSVVSFLQQFRFASRGNRRGGNRGNTYQPSTLKRKRRLGFLARMTSVQGRKIIKRRNLKGRWYLSH